MIGIIGLILILVGAFVAADNRPSGWLVIGCGYVIMVLGG